MDKKMAKHSKLVKQLDSFDLQAEQEGNAIRTMKQAEVKRPQGQKPNARTVDVRVLEDVFDNVYGKSGYIAS